MKTFPISILVLFYSFCIPLMSVRGSELTLTETDDTIRITQRGKPVLEYIKKARAVPEGVEEHFSRSGYIHPVYTPTGQELTGDYPTDHAHQHALFFAWTKSGYDGRKVDFWNQAKDLGRIEFREVVDLKREQQQVAFSVRHAFKVKAKPGETWGDVLDEVWTVTVHQTPDDHFLFDIVSIQQCVADKPLSLAKYHYGGMAIRGNYQWLKEQGDHSINSGDVQYLTSDGKDRWEGNHTRPNWVAFSGKIDGQDVSAAVFCSPKNFRAPQQVRIHPNKPYFCFAPMVEGPFKIVPGEKYVSRYRYLVTSKAANSKLINEHWQRYTKDGEYGARKRSLTLRVEHGEARDLYKSLPSTSELLMKTSNQERPPTDRLAEATGRTPSRLTIESNRDDYRHLPNDVGLDHDVSVQGLRSAAAHSSALLQLVIGLISFNI